MPFARLLREELRALPRGRFALPGAAVLLAAVALLAATVAGGRNASSEFLLPVFGFVPAVLIPIAAAQVAGARSSRFLQAVFTSPVGPTEYLLAKAAAVMLLGLAYLAAVLPFLLVQAWHLGFSAELGRYALLGLGMVAYCTGVGTLLGVLFTSRGTLAPLAVAVAAMIASVAAILVLDPVLRLGDQGAGAFLLRLLHLSGALLLHDALGLGSFVRSSQPAASGLAFALLCAGVFAAAWWLFARLQSPEGWEARGRKAIVAGVAVALVLLAPAAIAGVGYEPTPRAAPPGGSFGGDGLQVRIVPRGAAPPDAFPAFRPDVLDAGRANEVDLLLFVYPKVEDGVLRNVLVRLDGHGLNAAPSEIRVAEARDLPRMSPHGPMAGEWPYLRVPAVLTPEPPETLRENLHTLVVNVTYDGAGAERGLTANASARVHSDVPDVPLQMALVGLPAPAAALAAFVVRVRRSR